MLFDIIGANGRFNELPNPSSDDPEEWFKVRSSTPCFLGIYEFSLQDLYTEEYRTLHERS